MDAPVLLAIARARLSCGEGSLQGAWASPRALALLWAPDRRAGLEPGMAWIFMLNPVPELWLLHERDEAYLLLKAEARADLSRRWTVEVKGARLTEVQGDPRERWLGLVLRRRAITGRIEAAVLAFQAIPGRAGLRLDGVDLNPIRIGLGQLFAPGPADPAGDSPPYLRFQERFGPDAAAALAGQRPEVLPGEGDLQARHRAWSLERAAKLVLVPRKAGVDRKLVAERKRLERYREALGRDRERHAQSLGLRAKAQALAGELYRLRGTSGRAELLDGTVLDLPAGHRVEDVVQRWFAAVKRAERGLERVAQLEAELQRQLRDLEYREAQREAGLPAPGTGPWNPPRQKQGGKKKTMDKPEKRKDSRADGKGKAFRSVMVEGFEVLIGKGDADNDLLTFKVAEPLDLWLHVANTPGSHVVVRNPERIAEMPRALIERAAELAAFFSKARDGGKVEVHYCRAADVSKPRGFPPGKVMLKQWKSVRVYPKE
jgi:hypothetical protein